MSDKINELKESLEQEEKRFEGFVSDISDDTIYLLCELDGEQWEFELPKENHPDLTELGTYVYVYIGESFKVEKMNLPPYTKEEIEEAEKRAQKLFEDLGWDKNAETN